MLCSPEEHWERVGTQGMPGAGGELALLRAWQLLPCHTDFPDSLLFLLQECTNIFSKGGGEELAKHAGVPFLGEWPLEQSSA